MDYFAYTIFFILGGLLLSIILFSWYKIYKKIKNKEKLIDDFEEFANKNNLVIDKKQTLNKNMIGLDRKHKVLVFFENSTIPPKVDLISLADILSCKIIKKRNPVKGHINGIYLKCTFIDETKQEVLLPFYEERKDKFIKMLRLSKKAYYWEKSINLFSGMAKGSLVES